MFVDFYLPRGVRKALALLAVASVVGAAEVSEEHRFEVVTLAENLNHPWSLAFLPDCLLYTSDAADE